MNEDRRPSDGPSETGGEPELTGVAVALRRALHDLPADAEPSLATAPLLRAGYRARRRRRAAGAGLGLLLAGGAAAAVVVLVPTTGGTGEVTTAGPSSSAPASASASPSGTSGVVGTTPAPEPLPAETTGPDPSLFPCLKEFSVPAASQQHPLLSGWTGGVPVVLAQRPGATVLCTADLGASALSGSGAKRSAAETAPWHPTTVRSDGKVLLAAFRVPAGVTDVVANLGAAPPAQALVGAGWALAGMPVSGTGLQTLTVHGYDASGALVHTETLEAPTTGAS